jgi:hypothetical protein
MIKPNQSNTFLMNKYFKHAKNNSLNRIATILLTFYSKYITFFNRSNVMSAGHIVVLSLDIHLVSS